MKGIKKKIVLKTTKPINQWCQSKNHKVILLSTFPTIKLKIDQIFTFHCCFFYTYNKNQENGHGNGIEFDGGV